MFENYLKIALRALANNKLYAAINILGLAIGLTIYLFSSILADYERNHDTGFANHERVYTIGSLLPPDTSMGVKEFDNTYSSIGPLLESEIDGIEAMARTIGREYLVTVGGDSHFHEQLMFTDPALLQIFDFEYLAGGPESLNDPKGMVVTRETAIKWFGKTDIVGETILLNYDNDLRITGVIENIPKNTHFTSLITGNGIYALAPLVALNRIDGWELEGNWNNLSTGNQTYVMTKEPQSISELSQKVNAVFNRHAPPDLREDFMTGLRVRPLKDANTAVWDMIGMPIIESIQLLGFLILVIAIVNYTNLATAQSMGRAREVGLRKTMGASRLQLMFQFLTESLTIALISMLLAVMFLELLIPVFNQNASKVVELQYLTILPWLALTTISVGLVSGAYPSFLITRTTTLDALRNSHAKGSRGSAFRSTMIAIQFMLSIFMLAMVMIGFFQNQQVKESSNIYPKDSVVILDKMMVESIFEREDVLRDELLKINGVKSVTFASQVPFQQSNASRSVTAIKGDEVNKISVNTVNIDHDFISTFDIPVIAGRDFSRDITTDKYASSEVRDGSVIINEMAARRLGYDNPADIIGESFWGMPGEQGAFQYKVIGVIEDQNFLGLHNQIKPWIFYIAPWAHRFGGIKLESENPAQTITEIENTWKRVIPDYPIEHRFLNDLFNDIYSIYKTMNTVFAGFALIALLLALIGLFGLAAFIAKTRTKEIGVRKVLGASLPQIVTLLLWQFSKPVMWATAVALPLSYLASNIYLNFFAERISLQIPLIILAGLVAIALSWAIVAMHAIRVARANPIVALRYE